MEKANQSFTINSLQHLDAFAEEFLHAVSKYRVIAFYGEMGAGKTTIIKSICKAMDVVDNVTSPTFAIINEYKTTAEHPVFHFDFYRINRIEEVYDVGYEDYFYSGHFCLIEWPEMVELLLPPSHLKVWITVGPVGERICMLEHAVEA